MSALELDDSVYERIKTHCAHGDDLAELGDFASALDQYWQAWELLPEPKTNWEAARWILGTIGNANFLSGDFEAGRDNLENAMNYPGALGNPFIHLRLGQCQFELKSLDRAADELMRAYMGGGPEAFKHEDRKYLEFLSTRAEGIELPKPKSKWRWWK